MAQKFSDRFEAGKLLGEKFINTYPELKNGDKNNIVNIVILALPRGGVPIAYEMAKQLTINFDLLLVRKLGCPQHEELALGALAQDGHIFLNRALIDHLKIPQLDIDQIIEKEKIELERRNHLYRHNRPMVNLNIIKNKIVILVDDGIATGATMQVAIETIEQLNPQKIIVAAPIIGANSYNNLIKNNININIIYLIKPQDFNGIGEFYEQFPQLLDSEVIDLLNN